MARCLNCNLELESQFCPQCGQSSKVSRFDLKSIWNKLAHSLDFDRGFLRTLYNLLTSPGPSLRNYLEGKRVGFSDPIKLFFLFGAVSTWITYHTQILMPESLEEPFNLGLYDYQGYFEYSSRYLSFFTLTAIPFFSFFSWGLFIKRKYNYIEHLILNIWIGAGQFLMLVLMTPVIMAIDEPVMLLLFFLLNFGYNVWALVYFFGKPTMSVLVRGLIAVGIPQASAYFFNYLVYRLSPKSFWVFLDAIMN